MPFSSSFFLTPSTRPFLCDSLRSTQSFRTPNEAIKLANNSRYGLSAGVWTEQLGLALETALSVKAGVLWVNGHNNFDAAAGSPGTPTAKAKRSAAPATARRQQKQQRQHATRRRAAPRCRSWFR